MLAALVATLAVTARAAVVRTADASFEFDAPAGYRWVDQSANYVVMADPRSPDKLTAVARKADVKLATLETALEAQSAKDRCAPVGKGDVELVPGVGARRLSFRCPDGELNYLLRLSGDHILMVATQGRFDPAPTMLASARPLPADPRVIRSRDGSIEFDVPPGVRFLPSPHDISLGDERGISMMVDMIPGPASAAVGRIVASLQSKGCVASPQRAVPLKDGAVADALSARCRAGDEVILLRPMADGRLVGFSGDAAHEAAMTTMLGGMRGGLSPGGAAASPGLRSRDGSIAFEAPAGFNAVPSQSDDLVLSDDAKDMIFIDVAGAGDLDQALAPYRRQIERSGCALEPFKDIQLAGAATARGAAGRCGNGREVGVLARAIATKTMVALSSGRFAPSQDALAAARPAAGEPPRDFETPAAPGRAPLPPLPQRPGRDWVAIILLASLLSGGALGARALLSPPAPPTALAPGTGLPGRAEMRYWSLPVVYDVQDATGAAFRAVSSRLSALPLSASIGVKVAFSALTSVLTFAGFDVVGLVAAHVSLLGPVAGAFGLFEFVAFVIWAANRRDMSFFDAKGEQIFLIQGWKPGTFGSPVAKVLCDGEELFAIRRRGWVVIRRRWQLLDTQGNVFLEIVEDSALKALARKFCGHLWGLLRTHYILSSNGEVVGALTREWSVWNRFAVDMKPIQGLDHRVVLAAALFVDRMDPDRWHPWHA